MSGEAREALPMLPVLCRDIVLRVDGVMSFQKPHWLLPLPVVGGGQPITRH